MVGPVWLCLLALALPCWAYPSGHTTTCEEFGRGIAFDPISALGEWFTVYSFTGVQGNVTEKIIIRELSSSQLHQYDKLFKGYSNDKLKLEFKIHDSHPLVLDVDSVLVAQDDAGNVDAWATRIKIGDTELPMLDYAPYTLKWKSVDGFLVLMLCNNQKVYVVSRTNTPDEDKLKSVVDNLGIEGITGGRIYSSLLSLL